MPIHLHINETPADGPLGASLFEAAESIGVRVPTSCRKSGKCKECLVEVSEGMELLTPRGEEEAHLKDAFRLSCRCRVAAESGVVRCHTMRRGQMRIESHSVELLGNRERLPLNPAVTRDGHRVLLDGEQIDSGEGPIYGIAMDLGTTTVVLRLIDLENGKVVADASFENPQRFGGSDVMSRIQYDTEQKGRVLQRALLGYLSHAIEEFPVDRQRIYEVVVAANSTMRDILFGLDVYSIGQNPYQSLSEIEMAQGKRSSTSLSTTAKQLRLPIHPKARVHGLPIVSGHVGADAAACMLAVDFANEKRAVALMDIGTNTELIVGNRGRLIAASCPAGPAFEGGAIRFGMPGLPGAIEKVRLDDFGDEVESYSVIGDGEPVGICGSGLISLLSELLRTEKMNALGRFEDEPEIALAETDGERIVFTEGDVNELAQAKGANVAGLRIAFKELGIRFEDLDMFYLAGGFGRHLDLEASKRIGLIPNLPDERIAQVGNAAVEGACIALLSVDKRAELEAMVKRVRHCRLEADAGFFDFFVEGCQFKPVQSEEAMC
ncbi:ASKHA domain-containing protein [Pelagicoccus sp. SDUM812003]|uniref:ASKHA domain-containing protein n=1 Tax=Pelagicoccus sp. SDUM812003 TaxID=3041267 RepID=UPI00280D6C9E|nr:ASKHA domain-containing protein [Pelagicoccus sp. SDUM812003]MDQ8204531.1 ASKHA domain-containing protein [Pelagicoccus sp. SDUM812003]